MKHFQCKEAKIKFIGQGFINPKKTKEGKKFKEDSERMLYISKDQEGDYNYELFLLSMFWMETTSLRLEYSFLNVAPSAFSLIPSLLFEGLAQLCKA